MILDGMHIINNTVIEWEGNISISPTYGVTDILPPSNNYNLFIY